MLVVACNSVEVSAIGDIAAAAEVPVVGVIGPGVRAAVARHAQRRDRRDRHRGHGPERARYQRAVRRRRRVALHSRPVRSSWSTSNGGTRRAPRSGRPRAGYLAPLEDEGVDTVIMGCTHYPLLSGLLQLELGPDVVLVSSAEETAKDVYGELLRGDALRTGAEPPTHEFRDDRRRRCVPRSGRGLPRSRGRARRSRPDPRGRQRELTVLGSQGTWPGASRRVLRLPALPPTGSTSGSTPEPGRSRGSRSTSASPTWAGC